MFWLVGFEYSGFYFCCVYNVFGQVCSSQNFILSIVDESFVRVVLVFQDVIVVRNEEVMFYCQFLVQLFLSLQWFFEDEIFIINCSCFLYFCRVIVFVNGFLLLIQVWLCNVGVYCCIGQGQRGLFVILEVMFYLVEIEDMFLFELWVFIVGSEECVICFFFKGLLEFSVWWEYVGV